MVKRTKTSSSSELRSSQIPLTLHRYDLSLLRPSAGTYWGIQTIQPYFPPIEKLFKSSELENVSEYGIRLSDEVATVLSPTKIRTTSGATVEVHRKTTMLLSPYKWMRGEYGASLGLPSSLEQATSALHKLQNPNNAGYVGALVSAVLSQTGCQHFPKVYGVFTGTAAEHSVDISDDYGELCERPWFSQNIGKHFQIKLSEEIQQSTEFRHTRSERAVIQLGEPIGLGEVQELETQQVGDVVMGDLNRVLHDDEEMDNDDASDSSSVSTSYVFAVRSCACSDEEEEEFDEEDDTDQPFAWAKFSNVPVQVTVMEQCEGTLYELMMMNPGPEKHFAWISQVAFALAFAQRTIGFTHNDLHANNVMYVKTDKEYFYYNCGGVLYRVPTYGYLIKIIDFERGIASIKLTGMKEPKLFMSDHYAEDEEAGGMYNYGDFYNSKYPEVKPNPSCDLVRLATSIYWDLFSEDDAKKTPLHAVFLKWFTLEDGTSIFFGKKDPEHDRFHGFHSYKAIARYCKDTAVPRKEISSLKNVYGVDSVPEGQSVLLIEA